MRFCIMTVVSNQIDWCYQISLFRKSFKNFHPTLFTKHFFRILLGTRQAFLTCYLNCVTSTRPKHQFPFISFTTFSGNEIMKWVLVVCRWTLRNSGQMPPMEPKNTKYIFLFLNAFIILDNKSFRIIYV